MATMKAHPDDPRLQSWSAYAAQRISTGDDAAGLKRQKKAKEARTNVDDTHGWMTWVWCYTAGSMVEFFVGFCGVLCFKACCALC